MPISNVQLTQTFAWTLAATSVGGLPPVQQQGNGLATNLAGINTATWNQLYSAQFTLTASGGTNTVNLNSFTNAVGESVTLAHVHSVSVQVTGVAALVTFGPGASSGLNWFLGGTSPTISLPGTTASTGAAFTYQNAATAAGTAVTGSAKNLTFTNTGSGTATVTVIVLGSTT